MLRLRSLRPLVRCYSTELHSTLSKLHKSGSLNGYKSFLQDPEVQKSPEFVPELFKKVYEDPQIKDHEKAILHNTVLADLLRFDPSLNSHVRSLKSLGHFMTPEALEQVIIHNKGRVSSSWDIFEQWMTAMDGLEGIEIQGVLQQVLKKVIHGDPSEQDDGYVMDPAAVARAVWLMKNLELEIDTEILGLILQESLKNRAWEMVNHIGIQSLDEIATLNLTDEQLVMMWSMAKETSISPEVMENHSELLERLLTLLAKNVHKVEPTPGAEVLDYLNERFPAFSLEYNNIQGNNFDTLVDELSVWLVSPSAPGRRLRLAMLKCHGIILSDFKQSLKLYHEYIACDGGYVDDYMMTMVQISCYHAVKDDSQTFIAVAESLSPEPTPVKCLEAQILGKATFGFDDSLAIFNEHIGQLSKMPDAEGSSQSGRFVECLVLAALVNEQRELAYVIRDGAIQNGLVAGERAQERLKPLFRRYGEIMGEEDNHRELFKDELLAALAKL